MSALFCIRIFIINYNKTKTKIQQDKKLQTENLYNLTEAERMITNKKYYRNIFNKINIIENIDKHFYHKYNEILNKLDTK